MADFGWANNQDWQPPNTLQNYGNALDVQRKQLENQLLRGRIAGGQSVQGAIGPDGTVDVNALMQGIKSNPAAAPAAMDYAQGATELNQKQTGNNSIWDAKIAAQIGPTPKNYETIHNDIGYLVATKQIPPDYAAKVYGQVPRDPNQLKSWQGSRFNAGLSAENRTGTVSGPAVQTPNGVAQTNITRDQLLGIQDGTLMMDPSNPGSVIPKQGANGPTSQAIVAPPYGTPEAQAEGQKTGQQIFANISGLAANSTDRAAALQNLADESQKFVSGPLAQKELQIKRLINQGASWLNIKPQFDTETIAAHEAFIKQATKLAQDQAQLGTGTDQQLGTSLRANPSDALSNEGITKIVGLLRGNEAAIQARAVAAEQWRKQNGDGSGQAFQNFWNSNFSPRAFQYAYMSKKDRAEFQKTASPQDLKNVATALSFAVKNGWITPEQASK